MVYKIAVISDMHTGSTVGLSPPNFPIADGGYVRQNAGQQWLYAQWQDAMERIIDAKPDVGVILGDMIQGSHQKDGQLVTNRLDLQAAAAHILVEPFADAVGTLYIIRGTEWHEGAASENINALAKLLGAEPSPVTGQHSWWQLYLQPPGGTNKPVIHFAHHIAFTRVSWYAATAPLRDVLMLLTDLYKWYREDAPHLNMMVRAHRHEFIHVQTAPDIQTLVIPGWQLPTAYAMRSVSGKIPQIGYAMIEWDGFDLVVKPRFYRAPMPRVEVIQSKGE